MTAIRPLQTLACVLLAGSLTFAAPALAAFGLDWQVNDQGAVTELGILESFHTVITNTGDEFDTYTVSMVKNIPTDWIGSICVGETCYPPFVTEVEVPLGAGESAYLDIDVTPNLVTGYGHCTVTVSSQGNPALRPASDFTVVSTGLDLLLVVDDTTGGLADYYTAAVAGSDRTYGVWKQVEMGPLSNMELMEFGTVVWGAGNLTAALDTDAMSALSYYVQHGGNLFLNGRDLAYESCDPDSPYYSANSAAWFEMILGTTYENQPGPLLAEAFPHDGDPVGEGLVLTLTGGDGADNTAHTLDGLSPVGSGIASFYYHDLMSGPDAAIRNSYGDGKTYFCGFAFEAIDNGADRAAFMQRVLDWFDGLLVPAHDLNRPLLAGAAYAAPNPFNPQTSIKFEVGGERTVPAEIVIHDLSGRVVRRLFSGDVAPGPQDFVWNGRSDSGRIAATGVYLARVKLDGADSAHVKMTLVK